MSQRSDLGAIANIPGALFRNAINAGVQAIVTQHAGASEPVPTYANMVWFSTGDGTIKVRSPTNTSWQTIGIIGPPMKWTNIDLPPESFVTGDVKESYNPNQQSGWLLMNDGSIGSQSSGATSRPNPDTWPLFNLLWNLSSDDWCPVYAAGTLTRTGRGTSAAVDWNANRHLVLPRRLGRVVASAGWGAGLSNFGPATWTGSEYVALESANLPAHSHNVTVTVPNHSHNIAQMVDNRGAPHPGAVFGEGTGNLQVTSGVTEAAGGMSAGGSTSVVGSGAAHFNIQPTTYVYHFIKL